MQWMPLACRCQLTQPHNPQSLYNHVSLLIISNDCIKRMLIEFNFWPLYWQDADRIEAKLTVYDLTSDCNDPEAWPKLKDLLWQIDCITKLSSLGSRIIWAIHTELSDSSLTCCLSLSTSQRLMDHYPGIWQRVSLALHTRRNFSPKGLCIAIKWQW